MRLAPLDVLLFDTDLVCRFAAPAGDTLLGRSAADIVGQSALTLFAPDHGDLHSALWEAADDAGTYDYPAYRYAIEGADTKQFFCWSVRIQPVHLLDYRGREEFRGVLVTLADVQDLADERDRLQSAQERLLSENARLHAGLEDLRVRLDAERAAHRHVQADVRDLLAPVQGYLQLLAERPAALAGQTAESLIVQHLLPRLREVVRTVDEVARGDGPPSAP
jgi:hypothetical protein